MKIPEELKNLSKKELIRVLVYQTEDIVQKQKEFREKRNGAEVYCDPQHQYRIKLRDWRGPTIEVVYGPPLWFILDGNCYL